MLLNLLAVTGPTGLDFSGELTSSSSCGKGGFRHATHREAKEDQLPGTQTLQCDRGTGVGTDTPRKCTLHQKRERPSLSRRHFSKWRCV